MRGRDLELTPYPVLSASGHARSGSRQRPALPLGRWAAGTARDVWNAQRHESEAPFDALPTKIRNLTHLPLYMSLIRAANLAEPPGQTNAYRLIEFCASILKAAGLDVERAMADLTALARQQLVGRIAAVRYDLDRARRPQWAEPAVIA